ncbi:MAG TPA: hypothetical protein ENH82_05120 [bacterium]|nr:hypothetical protein [bacterium]
MTYLWGLVTLSLIVFVSQKLLSFSTISLPFKSLSFFKLQYLALGMILVLFFPNNFLLLIERTRGHIIMFCLAWIGLYYGCGLELRAHQKFPSKVILFNIIEPVIIFTFVTLVLTITLFFKFDGWSFTRVAVITAIFCSFTIFRRHGILRREGDTSHHPVLDDLLPVGNIFPVTALSIIGVLISGTHKIDIIGLTFTGIFSIIILNILLGVAGGILLNMLISGGESSDSLSIILIGVTALFGGMALVYSFSPLFIGTIAGAFLINSTLKRLQTLGALNNTNEIIERIFMFLLGTMLLPLIPILKINVFFILFYAAGLFVFRAALIYVLSSIWTSRFQHETNGSSLIWMGLTGQGIVASGAAYECSIYVQPSVFLLFVTLLVLNQLAIGFYMWHRKSH